jgi:esterase/lipase superfamily enzyme
VPNRLSVRGKGGSVADRIALDPASSILDLHAHRLVILIHGFDNSPAKAGESYAALKAQLMAQLPPGGASRIGAVWEFYWPSDQAHWPLKRFIRSYRRSLGLVETVGSRLAKFLLLHRRQQICLVGHSMGCRVALEALKNVYQVQGGEGAQDHLRTVVLLAAAVPVRQCSRTSAANRYGSRLSAWADHVIHSRNDRVLHYLFPLGQPNQVGEIGPAVGFVGGPLGRWTSSEPLPLRRTRRDLLALGHGQYWRSSEVARQIIGMLGLRAVRPIATRGLPSVALPEEAQAKNEVAGHALPSRT